jgi:DNA-directed RNA polymerase omega subunit
LTLRIGTVDSKFRFIVLAAKRTRQLQAGAHPSLNLPGKKFTQIAREEIRQGLVKYELVIEEQPKKKSKQKE